MNEVPTGDTISDAQGRVLARAAKRPAPHYVCPTPGLWAAAQTAVLRQLRRRGLITDASVPTLTAKGIEAAARFLGCTETTDSPQPKE